MVQILPEVPRFGTQLANVLTQAASNIGQGYLQGRQGEREAKQAESAFGVLNNPASTPLQQITAFTSLPEQYKKHAEPLWKGLIEPKIKSAERLKEYEALGLTSPQQVGTQQLLGQQQLQAQPKIQQPMAGQEPNVQPPVSKYANQIQSIDQEINRLTPLVGLKARTDNPLIAGKGTEAEAQIQNLREQKKHLQDLSAEERKEEREVKQEERKHGTQIKSERRKDNIKRLEEVGEGLKALDRQESVYKRLDELVKNPENFPNEKLAGLFTSHGELSPVAYSSLSPAAQEFVSLITSNFTGAKEMIGGRLTNFDVGLFLQTLPNLLQKPQGKVAVLNRLKKVANESKNYYESIQDQYEKEGAIENLDFFQAQRRALKDVQTRREEESNKEPEQFKGSEIQKREGQKVRKKSTGEIGVIKDGKWTPLTQEEPKKKGFEDLVQATSATKQEIANEIPKEQTPQEVTALQEQSVLPEEQDEFEQIFENYLPDLSGEEKERAESIPEYIGRNATRSILNVGTTLVGLPGDIAGFLGDYVAGPIASWITGIRDPESQKIKKFISELPGMKEINEFTNVPGLKGFGSSKNNLPTSKSLEELAKATLPEWVTTPQDVLESSLDDIVKDATSILAPIPGSSTKLPVSLAKRIGSAFLTSVGSNVASQAVEAYTGDSSLASKVKLGSMILLSTFGRPKAAEYAQSLYKKAEAFLPAEAKTSATTLTKDLKELRTKMTKGTLAPSEKFVVDEIDAVLSKVKNGKINVDEAWGAKRSLNEKLQKLIYDSPDKASKQRARKLCGEIQHTLKETIADYGKINPKFYKPFKDAEVAYGTLAQSEWIGNFMRENLNYDPKTSYLKYLLTGIPGALAGKAAGTAAALGGTAATAGGFMAYQSARALYQIAKSPALRKHYLDVVRSAAVQDASVMNKAVRKLDEAFRQQEIDEVYEMLPD